VITETWITCDEAKYYNLPDYTAFHSTRDDSQGGGVSIYVHKEFDTANEVCNRNWNGNNFIAVELLKEKKNVLCFYRQPGNRNDPTGSMFVEELNSILSNYKNCIVFGDFNLNIFDSSSVIENYKDVVLLNDYEFINSRSQDFPTRINYETGTFSCIDHIFSDVINNDIYKKISLAYFDFVSDHKALWLSIWKDKCSVKERNPTYSYKIVNNKKILSEKIIEKLESDNFNDLALDLKQVIDSNTITVTKFKKSNKTYINNEILKFIAIKRNYEKLKRKFPLCVDIHERWKFYRNKVSSLCMKAKKKFLDNFFERNLNDPRKTWQQINQILGKQSKQDSSDQINVLIDNGETITDKKLIANIMNNHYINISKNAVTNRIDRSNIINYHNNEVSHVRVNFECPECTEDEITLLISNLKNSNSKDVFGLSNNFVKIHSKSLTPILTTIINKHMFEGEFPEALKFSLVKPLYKKKGSKKDKSSYRPVSLVCILSKIFEGVIFRRITEHLKLNEFFHPDQFGYQSKSSTEGCMLHTLNDIYCSIDERLLTALLTIDLSSAFDCINHEVLLIKLSKLHFPNFFFRLLESFLADRSQSVAIGGIISERLAVFCGSPQGGVLSGLFFNIYVNPIFALPLASKLRLFCDDMSLIASGYDHTELKANLEYDLKLINDWLEFHCLSANYSKTNYVLFSGRKKFESFTERSLNIQFNNVTIERVESVKIIGLYVDELLNFSTHIEQLKRKINPFVAKLAKIRRFISESTALKLYYANVYSHLIFMNAIWSVAPAYLSDTLGVIQRRALRIVFRKDNRCHNYELFNEKILPFNSICEFHKNLVMFKIKHNLFKSHVSLAVLSDRHSYFTRNRNNFIVPGTSLVSSNDNFFVRAAVSFNALPEKVKKFHNITSFKIRLREDLFNKYQAIEMRNF
jgi:hypothetical protein